MKRWLTRTLIFAAILSVIGHFLTIFGEDIWSIADALLNGKEIEVRKTERQLDEQEIALEGAAIGDKPKLKPLVDKLNVYLVPAASLKPKAAKAAHKPVVAPKPRPAPKPAPKPEAQAKPVELAAVPTTDTVAASTPSEAPTPVPPPAAAVTPPAADAPAPPAAVAVAEPAAPQDAQLSQGKAFPADVKIHYLLYGVLEGAMSWKQDGNHYTIELNAAGFGKSISLRSRGTMSKDGLKPDEYLEFRDNKLDSPKFVVKFDWANGVVNYGEPNALKNDKLEKIGYDMLSLFFQAAIRGKTLMSSDVQIVTGKKIYHQKFHIEGESTIHVQGAGDITALALNGENERGKFAFWLAPGWHNLPVRAKVDASDGRSFVLDASLVEVNGKTLLARPKREPPRPRKDR
ncbi:DUF3108 domain-containing protein [Chitinivorax sp. PXF-14]|uniref:DUF3108 domain-containing protein n=1 Tax=Chitinivorax sp. PXF-14 TaxID=3230488 RepID=UPI003465C58A